MVKKPLTNLCRLGGVSSPSSNPNSWQGQDIRWGDVRKPFLDDFPVGSTIEPSKIQLLIGCCRGLLASLLGIIQLQPIMGLHVNLQLSIFLLGMKGRSLNKSLFLAGFPILLPNAFSSCEHTRLPRCRSRVAWSAPSTIPPWVREGWAGDVVTSDPRCTCEDLGDFTMNMSRIGHEHWE